MLSSLARDAHGDSPERGPQDQNSPPLAAGAGIPAIHGHTRGAVDYRVSARVCPCMNTTALKRNPADGVEKQWKE
jgi:hypothetical protein